MTRKPRPRAAARLRSLLNIAGAVLATRVPGGWKVQALRGCSYRRWITTANLDRMRLHDDPGAPHVFKPRTLMRAIHGKIGTITLRDEDGQPLEIEASA